MKMASIRQEDVQRVHYKGYEILLGSVPHPSGEGSPLAWLPRATIRFRYRRAWIQHVVGEPTPVASRGDADGLALRRARQWIDAMGNPKAALEDAVFARLSADPQTFLDYVIKEYFEPSHPLPALEALTPTEQDIFHKALYNNWRRMQAILTLVKPAPGEFILDAGCGVGGIAYRIACAGASVVALDVNQQRLSMARVILSRLGVRLPFLRANCIFLPFRDSTFDKVLLANVVEHLLPHEREQAVEEIWRVLRPGGKAYIYTDNALHARLRVFARRLACLARLQDPRRWNAGFSGVPRAHGDLLDPRELTHLLKQRGFKVRIYYSVPSVPALGLLVSRFFCAVAEKQRRVVAL